MKQFCLLAASLSLLASASSAAEITHRPASAPPGMAGDTIYLSGTTDGGARLGGTPAEAAKRVMDNFRRSVEGAGLSMENVVWVQVFSTDLADYAAFNEVYRTYFRGPLPARAYLGAAHLLGDARFEVMGVAVRPSAK
jgi:2-iminobutanoate/2-iminopropanoate deaminase